MGGERMRRKGWKEILQSVKTWCLVRVLLLNEALITENHRQWEEKRSLSTSS